METLEDNVGDGPGVAPGPKAAQEAQAALVPLGKCPGADYVMNPMTRRWVKRDGTVYRALVHSGNIKDPRFAPGRRKAGDYVKEAVKMHKRADELGVPGDVGALIEEARKLVGDMRGLKAEAQARKAAPVAPKATPKPALAKPTLTKAAAERMRARTERLMRSRIQAVFRDHSDEFASMSEDDVSAAVSRYLREESARVGSAAVDTDC